MKIICDACSAKYSIADEKVRGKVFKIRCKKCSNIIVVRGTEEEAAVQRAVPEKETQVYNYNDPDSEGEWHLVIDDEQVGPMTADEVRARFAAGDVDEESFIWKDGMGDWEPLTEIPEFADLAGSEEKTVANAGIASVGGSPDYTADEPKSEADSIFGGVDMNESSSPAADDLFASQTAAQKPSDEAAAMFGTGGIDSGNNNIFGDDPAPAPASDDQQLTGQRSDNSVLFSISDLAGANQSSRAPSSSAPASAPSESGVTEGSGLIDIRSMAQVYLGDKNSAASDGPSTGSDDDLPVFSQTGFEHAEWIGYRGWR
jgi:predicted Zn finger-like uncharacterized protein